MAEYPRYPQQPPINMTQPLYPQGQSKGNINAASPPPTAPLATAPPQQPFPHPTMAGYPQYPQQQPYNTTQPPYPQGPSNPTIINVVSPAAAPQGGVICLGPAPTRVKCPCCNQEVLTVTHTRVKDTAYICCLIMFFTALWFCSCLPYFMDSMKVTTHCCPNCKIKIGIYRA